MSGVATAIAIITMAVSYDQQKRAEAKQDNALLTNRMAEQERQDAIQRERDAAIKAALPNYTGDQQRLAHDELAARNEAYLSPADRAASSGEYSADTSGQPTEIADRLQQQLAGALTKSKDYAKNLAAVRGYNDLQFTNTLDMNRLQGDMGMLNNFSGTSAGLLNGEMANALKAGDKNKQNADIASGVGNLAFQSWLKRGGTTTGGAGWGSNVQPAVQAGSNWAAYGNA